MAIRISDPKGLIEGQDEEPGLLASGLGGLLVGARRDPILRPAINFLAENVAGVSEADLDDLEVRLEGSSLAQVGELVGEFGSAFALGAGAYGLGRAAFLAVARAAAPRLAARGGASFLGRQGAQIQARLASEAALPQGLSAGLPSLPISGLERGAQIAGGALGEGAFAGAVAAAEGGDQTEIVQSAALGALLTGGLDLGLTAVGRAFSRTQRVDTAAVKESARSSVLPQFAQAIGRRVGQLEELQTKLLTLTRGEDPDTFKAFSRAVGKKGQARQVGQVQKKIGAVKEEIIRLEGFTDFTDLGDARILRETPLAPSTSDVVNVGRRALQYFLSSPEAAAGKLGVATARTVQLKDEVETLALQAEPLISAKLLKTARSLARNVGRTEPKTLKEADDLLEDVLEVAEKEGPAALRERFGDGAETIVRQITQDTEAAYAPIVRGSTRKDTRFLSPEELERNGVRAYFPQVFNSTAPNKAKENLLKFFKGKAVSEAEAEVLVADVLSRARVDGLQKVGSIDYQRKLGGTLAEKRRSGVPLEGYFSGLDRYLKDTNRRRLIGERFGYDKQQINRFLDTVKSASVAEGADLPAVTSLLDNLFFRPYAGQAEQRIASAITNFQAGTKLTFASIFNLGQGANNIVTQGLKSTAKGVAEAFRRGSRSEDAARFVGLQETELDSLRRAFGGVEGDGITDRFARIALNLNLFTPIERFNRLSGATTAMSAINDTVARALKGKLKGTSLDAARRQFRSMDLDLDRLLANRRTSAEKALASTQTMEGLVDAVFGQGSYGKAVFRATQQTQFLPSQARIPPAWRTPWGRLLFQFKSFALNQTTFIRDQVIGEFAEGNTKPLLTMLAVYPLAGEVLASFAASVKDRDRPEGIPRVVEDVAAIGGFGILQSAVTAAKFGRLKEYFLGPTLNDLSSLGENLFQGDLPGLQSQLSRLPVAVAGRRLMEGGVLVGEALEDYFPSDETEVQAMEFDDFRALMIQESRRQQ